MFPILRTLTLSLLCLSLLSSGCGKTSSQPAPDVPHYAVTCVGVLPAATGVNGATSPEKDKLMQTGLRILDKSLQKFFISRTDIRLVSDGQISGMDNLPDQPLARASVIADRLSCNAILETTLNRFQDRVGKSYSVDEPASISFDYRLLSIPEGAVLCRGTFDKAQQSVMENIFNLKSNKAFSWMTAQELIEEGLTDRFSDCPYLIKVD